MVELGTKELDKAQILEFAKQLSRIASDNHMDFDI